MMIRSVRITINRCIYMLYSCLHVYFCFIGIFLLATTQFELPHIYCSYKHSYVYIFNFIGILNEFTIVLVLSILT